MRSRSEPVGLTGALEQPDRQARPLPADAGAQGFSWDTADAGSRTWWPQGLTSSDDGRVLLSAWYAKGRGDEHVATRVSVVNLAADRSAPPYAHVQLVEKGGQPVRVHAGGLAWRGSRLLVTDTWQGIRVFDLDDVERAGADGFALPQTDSWTASWADRPLRWSFLSLDTSAPGELSLVAGEYDRRGTGARLARWAADRDTGLPERDEPEEILTVDIASMQGAVRVDGTYVVAASDGRRRRGHLWTGRAGGAWRQHHEALPVGPEDLSYDRVSRRLWTQTEYPGRRIVLSLPLPCP
ncbi:MAG: hypothetical protein M3353_03520 [Actinomycetota bacterium]|nr:hypothetical protein [Actinomycetota bacterium]